MIDPQTTRLDFPHGSTLTVLRTPDYAPYDQLIGGQGHSTSHTIGPCSIVDSKGNVDIASDGTAKWVGTVSVQAPPESDITIHDRVVLPNGDLAVVVEPPKRPTNPFTGWSPLVKFTLAAAGYTPAHGEVNRDGL